MQHSRQKQSSALKKPCGSKIKLVLNLGDAAVRALIDEEHRRLANKAEE
jgi:hypothetical protein